jgi:hypothetical protein
VQVHQGGVWHINFRRTFGTQEGASWNELQAELRSLQLSDSMDSVSWGLEPFGVFTTKSLYHKVI